MNRTQRTLTKNSGEKFCGVDSGACNKEQERAMSIMPEKVLAVPGRRRLKKVEDFVVLGPASSDSEFCSVTSSTPQNGEDKEGEEGEGEEREEGEWEGELGTEGELQLMLG